MVEAPRGKIMDRNEEVLVQNTPIYTVTYTENSRFSPHNREIVAERLAKLLDWDKGAILHEMDKGVPFAPTRIKQDLSFETVSKIEENRAELPGIDMMIDAERAYPYGPLFRHFLGKVGPIQADQLQYYQSRGYRMNDMVGTSYLEWQYEEQLRGKEGVIEVTVDRQLKPMGDPVFSPGQRGNDLVLTIDRKLQQTIENVIEDTIAENDMVDEAFFVAMNPKTGEILGMSNDVRTIGAGKTSYAMGSTVKMATVLMGLQEGVVTPNTTIYDTPMRIGNLTKKSWTNLGNVNTLTALQRSSNIFMFRIGLDLNHRLGDRQEAFDRAHYYFSQFGLGVKTGIDLPEEYDGYKSDATLLGLLADFMIGQYHNYTPLQLAQYVSTIANDGYRMQPYVVKEIRRGTTGEVDLLQVVKKTEPKVLNRVDMSDDDIQLVKRGMEMVTEPGGTAYRIFRDFPVKVAAKTGTAQTVEADGSFGNNHTLLVGYAPADDPQIAFASVVPKSQKSNSQGQVAYAQLITKQILTAFFDLNEHRE
nr:penicillin-binding transpeptidase domain-containing protein [Caldalkalibacillus salinus]